VRHREVVEELSQVPPAMPDNFVPDVQAARQIVTAAVADGRKWLEPVEIKRLLEAYDIAMVPTYAADDVEQAVAYANEIFAQGATVVLKIMSRDIVHKSDVGGVVLNLTTAEAVRAAAIDILARARKLRPEARIEGVIVQAMVVKAKARELILGLADDPTFGTVVVLGRRNGSLPGPALPISPFGPIRRNGSAASSSRRVGGSSRGPCVRRTSRPSTHSCVMSLRTTFVCVSSHR